jgi:ABC-type branched-subunit amino acid transport system substrate-binding protein
MAAKSSQVANAEGAVCGRECVLVRFVIADNAFKTRIAAGLVGRFAERAMLSPLEWEMR